MYFGTAGEATRGPGSFFAVDRSGWRVLPERREAYIDAIAAAGHDRALIRRLVRKERRLAAKAKGAK